MNESVDGGSSVAERCCRSKQVILSLPGTGFKKYQISICEEEKFSQKVKRQGCFGRQDEALLAVLKMNSIMCSNECQKAKLHLIHAQFKIFQ